MRRTLAGLWALIPVALVATAAPAAPVVTYTVEGTLTFDAGSSTGDAGVLAAIQAALPNGTQAVMTFDLDFGTPDADPAPGAGDFIGAVSGGSASVGGFAFAPAVNACANSSIECRVGALNDFVLNLDQFTLTSEVLSSAPFDAAIAPPMSPFFSAGVTFFLDTVAANLFAAPTILDPTTIPLDGRMSVFFINPQIGGVGAGRFTFDIADFYEGEPRTTVPLPGTAGLAMLGLLGLGAAARRQRR